MYKQIIALSLLLAVSNAQNLVGWRDCGTTMAQIQSIVVSGCSQTPCSFVPGSTYRLQLTGIALVYSAVMNYEMTAEFLGVPFPLASGNACNNLVTGECPAVPGAQFSYILDQPVPNFPPGIPAVVRLTVQNDEGTTGICIEVDVILSAN